MIKKNDQPLPAPPTKGDQIGERAGMKSKVWKIIALIILSLATTLWAGAGFKPVEIKILFDNYESDPACKTGWGFSCLISGLDKKILFDTGADKNIFLGNAEALKVDLTSVDVLVISHLHGDHIQGIDALLAKKPGVQVYIPNQDHPAARAIIESWEKAGAKVVVVKQPLEICPGASLTGAMSAAGKAINEQSLILDTAKGAVIITGCAHQGILSILDRTKTLLKKNIDTVLGGFHLLDLAEKDLRAIIDKFREFGVQRVGATHCTGDKAILLFQAAYQENFIKLGAGKSIVLQ